MLLAEPALVPPPPWLWPRAAYVHVPFCAHHCGYCDFAVAAGQDHLIDRYLDALAAELATLGQPQPVQTLFLGGGTPTHLTARQLERLAGRRCSAGCPWPTAANSPSRPTRFTCDADKVEVLADHGVNRVSLGAQSFHPHLLRRWSATTTPTTCRAPSPLSGGASPRYRWT